MKSILMSIKPQWVAKILNGEKTIEIRKKFPKDYVGWVYIYCTKGKTTFEKTLVRYHDGEVVARFWCDKVEEIFTIGMYYHETKTLDKNELPRLSCLSCTDLDNYLQGRNGYAIHITKLEIFDKPKEISEFLVFSHIVDGVDAHNQPKQFKILKHITRPPQSWCYIENI